MIIFSTPFVQTSFVVHLLTRLDLEGEEDRKFVVIVVRPGRLVRYITRLLDQPTESYHPPRPIVPVYFKFYRGRRHGGPGRRLSFNYPQL